MAAIIQKDTKARDRGGALVRLTALLLVLEPALMVAAFLVLGSSIDWPASLDEPAGVNLPLIVEERGAVILGYVSYLIYSLLILPISVMLYFALKDRGPSPLLAVAAAVGVVSALTRALGIGRWLFLMPALAEVYLDPASSQATRDAVEVAYTALNEYAGGIGEIFGVSLTGALWVGLTSAALLRSERFPSWLGLLGLLTGVVLLAGVAPVFGVDPGALITVLGVSIYLIWAVALAVVLLRQDMRSRRESGVNRGPIERPRERAV